jgi:proline dehydrogenase
MKDHLVSFDDTETAFKSRSDKELKSAYWLFKLISFNWLVQISPPFVHFALWAKLPVKGLIRSTIFHHFCGGENISDCKATIEKLADYNIGTILDYSVEGKESEKDFEDGLHETLATIKRAKGDKNIPFSVFKPTGFARFEVLEKKNAGETLTASEEKEFADFKSRIEKICQTAFENNVPVYIDAEQSWIQNVVDNIARDQMMKYNKEKVIVYNTLQMYRTGRVDYLIESINHAKANNYKTGFKIVRGAYMERERKRAAELNIASPIHPDKESTDKDYNEALKVAFENLELIAICCGTHNEQSCLHLVELMEANKISNNDHRIWFSQLYGMSDHISYNLAKKGFNVSKYVPYGPVEGVLPYLIRRAQENTSVAGQTGRELSLIKEEMNRRKMG